MATKATVAGHVKYAPGNWQVLRNCCVSGNCFKCRGALTGTGSVRIVHATGYSKDYAEWVALNWSRYKAAAEPMSEEHERGPTPPLVETGLGDVDRLRIIREIIERVEARCMTGDIVTNTRHEMTDNEMREIYVLAYGKVQE